MKRKPKKELKVELIPVYIPKHEFDEKKEQIQNLIAKILIQANQDDLKIENVVQSPPPN